MRVGNFSAFVPEGREHGSGHVALEHGSVYTLRLQNSWWDRECDAEVTVDGKPLGAFRIGKGQTITLERSPNDNGRFTFFKAATSEGEQAGASEISSDDRGLIAVRFRPGHAIRPVKKSYYGPCGQSMGGGVPRGMLSHNQSDVGTTACSMEAGVTGLTGHSSQRFVDVASLNYDASEEATIHLRLVAEAVSTVRKLQPTKSNPIPAAV